MPSQPLSQSPRSAEPPPLVGRPLTAVQRAETLTALFFGETAGFGGLCEVRSEEVPEPGRRLLDHRGHMTVTMEAFVGGPLSLRVLQESRGARESGSSQLYAREIELLASSGEPGQSERVQYGIVRMNLAAIPIAARQQIESGMAPLGRILIEAGILREVHDVSLIRITAGPELARRIGREPGVHLYGRVATISLAPCAGSPAPYAGPIDPAVLPHSSQAALAAIELLEIPLVG